MSLYGHLWTIARYTLLPDRPAPLGPSVEWTTDLDDPKSGRLTLSGRFRPEGESLVVIVHGLGGCSDSGYVPRAEAAAVRSGLASLALNVRGADRRGGDFGHAAMTADLVAALASPDLDRYARIHLLGYSLGGHLVLRYATESPDQRVASAAAICSPLDLARCCDFLDRPAARIYRYHLLRRLMEIYSAIAAEREVPIPVEEARRIRLQREFDDRIVAPHHGFSGVDEYYGHASVGPHLERLKVPALLVAAPQDPIVPAETLEPFLDPMPSSLTLHWASGGHVGFPKALDLGQPGQRGLEAQVISWLLDSGRDRAATRVLD